VGVPTIGAQIGRKRVVSRYALPIQIHRRGVAVSQEYIEIRSITSIQPGET
jgi:hypothetical protein